MHVLSGLRWRLHLHIGRRASGICHGLRYPPELVVQVTVARAGLPRIGVFSIAVAAFRGTSARLAALTAAAAPRGHPQTDDAAVGQEDDRQRGHADQNERRGSHPEQHEQAPPEHASAPTGAAVLARAVLTRPHVEHALRCAASAAAQQVPHGEEAAAVWVPAASELPHVRGSRAARAARGGIEYMWAGHGSGIRREAVSGGAATPTAADEELNSPKGSANHTRETETADSGTRGRGYTSTLK